MAREHLSQELIDAGEALLAQLDRMGVPVEGAMWLRSHLLDDWRCTVFTSLVDRIGRRDVYRALLDGFETQGMPPPLRFEDVHLESAETAILGAARSALEGTDGTRAAFKDRVLDGAVFDGLAYRWVSDASSQARIRSAGTRFGEAARTLASAR